MKPFVELGSMAAIAKLITAMVGSTLTPQRYRAQWVPLRRERILSRVEEIFVNSPCNTSPEARYMSKSDWAGIGWWQAIMGDYAILAYGEATPEETSYLFNRLSPAVAEFTDFSWKPSSLNIDSIRIEVINLKKLWDRASGGNTSDKVIAIDSVMSLFHHRGLEVVIYHEWNTPIAEYWAGTAAEEVLERLKEGTLLNASGSKHSIW